MQTPVISSTPQADYTGYPSSQDASVNWDRPAEAGRIETRYVRRCPDYFAVYLSSQTGCDQGCRMCHLTGTGQTRLRDVTHEEFLQQAGTVLDHYRREAPPARAVHFNFMARGEPLANAVLLSHADALLGDLARRAVALGLRPRYLVSTIFPRELGERLLEDIFLVHHPEIYYSIYSVNERFRRRWLPKALPAGEALDRLASWQRSTYKLCKIHYAFIAGENDGEDDVHAICDALESRRLMAHVNIVRYNPQDPRRHGVEPPEEVLRRNAKIYQSRLPYARVQIIPRVGYDVHASCGMFFAPEGPTPEQVKMPCERRPPAAARSPHSRTETAPSRSRSAG
jgi:adenine C2-methylase RlmN of 23S rRNA A2503 and tRNA A37